MKTAKKVLSIFLAVLITASCWVWGNYDGHLKAAAANEAAKDKYLFAYFTGTSIDGQSIHLAVSEDGYNYTALRNNEAVIIPSKGVGQVRDPYIWYNEQDNYYYILATDLDFTDGGGDSTKIGLTEYSENSESFIIWRSEDLINWSDETMIDVGKMAHLIGDTRNMGSVWAPQVLWDGASYVVYFSLKCNETASNGTGWNNLEIVYLKTTDLLDFNAYYEYGVIYDAHRHIIDADIIYREADDKYYMFYKDESGANGIQCIYYMTSEFATGPYTAPGNLNSGRGPQLFSWVGKNVEGCNSHFDNEGNLITYVDEYDYKNAAGQKEAHFHISKCDNFDDSNVSAQNLTFAQYTGTHNINSLSPRHGSVIKITTEEYNRLLDSDYAINSSSYPMHDDIDDHIVARYFTTDNVYENAVPNMADLHAVYDNSVTMVQQPTTGSWYAQFTNGHAEIDLDALLINGLNYDDGFTITFKAQVPTTATYDERIFDISTHYGITNLTGAEFYAHFSAAGGGTGSYMGTYNGPDIIADGLAASTRDWASDMYGVNRRDNYWHEYIISSANGNYMVWCDGKLIIVRNRFNTAVTLDEAWYNAIGDAQLHIGGSAWAADKNLTGNIRDFCVYDCSMSYYDIKEMDAEMKLDTGWINPATYNGITTKVPTFQNTNADRMNSLPNSSQHFSNILYTSNTVPNYDGSNMSDVSAGWHYNGNDFYYGLFYPETTVLLYDGVNAAIMPVSFGAYCENSRPSKGFLKVYPTTAFGSTTDLGELEISANWAGWYNNGDYYNCIVSHEDGYIGRNSSTSSWSHITDKKNYDCYWGAPLKVTDSINFDGKGYKKFTPSWYIHSGTDGTYQADHSGHITTDHSIYVINYKALLDIRNDENFTKAAYNSVMYNNICPELKAKYAQAVFTINTLNPLAYDFSSSTTAAILSTQAFSKAITDAVDTYNGVLASIEEITESGTSTGHMTVTLDAREATCSVDGLTQGSFCKHCGEVFEEQKVIPSLPHNFGEPYTSGGVEYVECADCGLVIKNVSSEVRYENLFSLRAFYNSTSNRTGFSGSSVDTDLNAGTITVKNGASSGEVYTNSSGTTTRDFNMHCVPVKGNTKYVVEATVSGGSSDVFIFKYDKDGNLTGGYGDTNCNGSSGTLSREFTTDEDTCYVEFRFDSNTPGATVVFSEIGLYTYESWSKFANNTPESRTGYWPGDDKELIHPTEMGKYSFDYWHTPDGAKIENTNQLSVPSVIVYAEMIPLGHDVTYDNMFSLASWSTSNAKAIWYDDIKDSAGATVGRKSTTKGIRVDPELGTISLYRDPNLAFCRTNLWNDYGCGNHYIYVEPNTKYTFEITGTADVSGARFGVCIVPNKGSVVEKVLSADGNTSKIEFTTASDASNLRVRFDNHTKGSTLTLSNIAMYKTADAYKVEKISNGRVYRNYYEQYGEGIGNLYDYTPERPGYTFVNWWKDTSATAATYDENKGYGDYDCTLLDDAFQVTQNWQVYSQWTENHYNIAFDANGGTGSMNSISDLLYTTEKALPANTFTKVGYYFAGWTLTRENTGTVYDDKAEVSELGGDDDETVTLYAQWAPNRYTLYFDSLLDLNGWTPSSSKGVVSNITNNSFTLTSNEGEGEATVSTPYFEVKPGVDYVIDVDVTVSTPTPDSDWDIYIFFCDANGSWVDFADGETNRFSETTTWDNIFTAPDKESVVKAQIRFDSNGGNKTVRFENIRVYEKDKADAYIEVDYLAGTCLYDAKIPTLPTPVKEGFNFLGWYDKNDKQVTAGTVYQYASDVYLRSKWQITKDALKADSTVVDFNSSVKFSPFENDIPFTREAALEGNSYKFLGVSSSETGTPANTLTGTYGTFTVSGTDVTYTPNKAVDGVETVYYHASISIGGTASRFAIPLTVAPASNVLYEENVFTESGSTVAWSTDGTAGSTGQLLSGDGDIYGYDPSYNNSLNNFSNGSALTVTVNSTNKTSNTRSFAFKGSRADVMSVCGPTTGIQIIKIMQGTTIKKAFMVDTYFNDKSIGTLYQVPIATWEGDYDSYTVQVNAAYLSNAGALKTASAMEGTISVGDSEITYNSTTATSEMDAVLKEVGLDSVNPEDIEIIWMDDNSVLNGGSGVDSAAPVDGDFSLDSTTSVNLVNYLDGIRVYNPLNADPSYYCESEKNANYYNIVNALSTENSRGSFAYVENSSSGVSITNYVSAGPKNEIIMLPSSTVDGALTFSVPADATKVMIGARAPQGTGQFKVGETAIDVSSATEMYYDITEYVADDGTVTIQNSGTNLIAINNVKVVGATLEENASFNLDSTAMMMTMSVTRVVDGNTPVVDDTETEDVPSTDDGTDSGSDSDDSDSDMSIWDRLKAAIKSMINDIIEVLRERFFNILGA